MEAREDSPRTGVELERLVDGHIGGKLLLVHHRSITFSTTPFGAPQGCGSAEYACKPDSVPTGWAMTISLGRALPNASLRLCSCGRAVRMDRAVLLQVGFTRARVSARLREPLPHDFTLTPTLARRGGMFLWHFPSSHPDRTLSCTQPYEARTFLPPISSRGGHPAYSATVVYHRARISAASTSRGPGRLR